MAGNNNGLTVRDQRVMAVKQVLNEQSLFDAEGQEYRPDRVVLQGRRALIVDYKFGQEKESYLHQLRRYAALWHELGY